MGIKKVTEAIAGDMEDSGRMILEDLSTQSASELERNVMAHLREADYDMSDEMGLGTW